MLAGRIDCSRRARLAINFGNRRRDFAGRGPWLGYERGAPVELQLADGFVNVGQRPVGKALGRLESSTFGTWRQR